MNGKPVTMETVCGPLRSAPRDRMVIKQCASCVRGFSARAAPGGTTTKPYGGVGEAAGDGDAVVLGLGQPVAGLQPDAHHLGAIDVLEGVDLGDDAPATVRAGENPHHDTPSFAATAAPTAVTVPAVSSSA
ncbi:hypothetical protein GCM10010261_64460 [Streptomyces pilosus]|nr:hypothetical protein GCM10010261_64460 [Streptomyces pilosus]